MAANSSKESKKSRIFTSYYASPKLDASTVSVSVSRHPPKWFKPDIAFGSIGPSPDLLKRYKAGAMTEAQYTEEYNAFLSTVDKNHIRKILLNALNNAPAGKDRMALLCYEKSGDFCHRHLLAAWLGSKIKEL